MARAYQESHILDSLTSSVKALQTQTADLAKSKGHQEEKITNLTKQNLEQAKKIEALETRVSANEHNAAARVLNAHLPPLSHTPLTPLHDLSTDRPIRHFPKHERDIRTMGPSEVIQVLQALGVKSLGMSAAEKKGEVRAQTGLPREAEKEGVVEKGEGEGKAEVPKTKTVPKVAPGSTAEKVGKMGTATAKGVGKPVVGGKAGEEKKP